MPRTRYFRWIEPRTWLHPVGFGTLGFALPAGIGAKFGCPDKPVAVMIGDYGIQYTINELGTAAEHKLPLVILMWNNDALGQIRDDMVKKGIQPNAVTLINPDFQALAKAYRCHAEKAGARCESPCRRRSRAALKADGPTLIEMTPRMLELMSGHSQFALLATRRFLPLFVTQAIGAFNDNAFRFALSILLIYDLGPRLGLDAALVNTLSAGLLILPFFLFSALAGQLADKYDKAMLARRIKLVEIAIIALASVSLFTDHVWLQLLCVFLTGTQSAFFGPIKYSILPQHLDKHELLGGNGLIEMGTFLSVLLGTMFGGFFIRRRDGPPHRERRHDRPRRHRLC